MTGRGFTFWFLAGAIAGLIGLALLIFASPGFPATEPWDGVGPFTGMWAGGPFAPVVAESGGGDDPAAQDMENITFGDYADGTTLEAIGFDTATSWTVSSARASAEMAYSGSNLVPDPGFESVEPNTNWANNPAWNSNLDYVYSGTKSMSGTACYKSCVGCLLSLSNGWHQISGHVKVITLSKNVWDGMYVWSCAVAAHQAWGSFPSSSIVSGFGSFSTPFLARQSGTYAFDSDGYNSRVVDDVGVYELAEGRIYAVYDYGKTYSKYSAAIVSPGENNASGLCFRLNSEMEGVYVYQQVGYIGATIQPKMRIVVKQIDGTWALKSEAAFTYSSGAVLEARENDVTKDVDVYYNDVKVVSSNADILDTFTGTIHGICAMSDAAMISTFVLTD